MSLVAVFGVVVAALGGEAVEGGSDVESLRRQVKYLSESLAGARAESDALRSQLDRKRFDEAGGDGAEMALNGAGSLGRDCKILEINEDLGIVVLNAGRRQGIRPGLQFTVMREARAIARVRVINVRAMIAGAVLQKVNGSYPRAQDRAVLVTGTGE
jgi:hypothetical protein